MKYIYENWLEHHGRYPSTGLLSLMFALHVCDEVDVYGFGADSKGHWHHYWENNTSGGAFRKTGVHDGDFEFNITLTLASIEKIKFFKGRWPWPQEQVGAAISSMQQNKAQWRWSRHQPGLNAWICGGFGASHTAGNEAKDQLPTAHDFLSMDSWELSISCGNELISTLALHLDSWITDERSACCNEGKPGHRNCCLCVRSLRKQGRKSLKKSENDFWDLRPTKAAVNIILRITSKKWIHFCCWSSFWTVSSLFSITSVFMLY